jgi:hypothetical protein
VDWKNLYKRAATPKEQLRGEQPITQFGRMCAKLGIALIAANSPQAKGRVERVHGTHQDRLVKKLRRKEISNQETANVYLEREYVPEHNGRFAREAAEPEDYHRRAPGTTVLQRIFRLENQRTVGEDWVVRYNNRFFQLQPQSGAYPSARSKVVVCEGQHGAIAMEYKGRAQRWCEIPAPTPCVEEQRACTPHPPRVQRKWVPPANHPWREVARREVEKRARWPPLARPSVSP